MCLLLLVWTAAPPLPPIRLLSFWSKFRRRLHTMPCLQCRINHGADGARARGPRPRGAPSRTYFLRQRELVVGCTAPHGTCLSWLRKALPKSEVVGERRCLLRFDRSCLIVSQHHLTDDFHPATAVFGSPYALWYCFYLLLDGVHIGLPFAWPPASSISFQPRRLYPSTTVLVIWQPWARQRCPKYDRLRLRTCPSNSRIMSSSCRMLSSVLSVQPAHFRSWYLPLIAHLQCPSFCSVRQHRPYQCLNHLPVSLPVQPGWTKPFTGWLIRTFFVSQ